MTLDVPCDVCAPCRDFGCSTHESRPGPTGRRALLALYRNYPATAPDDRYNWKAYAEARRLRDELLAWAATKSDEELLWCRNLGPVALRWIRSHAAVTAAPVPDTLDDAWAAAEAALPEGWRGPSVTQDWKGDWYAYVYQHHEDAPRDPSITAHQRGEGVTPIEALRALAAALAG